MFSGAEDAAPRATQVADYFADYTLHRSHSLGITRDKAREKGVKVTDLEQDPVLQDLVLSVHHATMHTFSSIAVKIVENNLGKAFVKAQQMIAVPQQVGPMAFPAGPPAPPVTPTPAP
jgi:hypothetical protein